MYIEIYKYKKECHPELVEGHLYNNLLRQDQYDNESTKLHQFKFYNLTSNSETI
ncbi:hypothetical protein IWQ47_001647 [Aquimarina sp. EL_43]|nr:hypothetical protein [Aquimarina sp. EL_35]MBG6149050.1 hypothetical protein [Aquimarina sp. EL_32]MBG6168576.1 hypothetical protein [Aquimarina sp. EL_43]